MPSIKQFDKVKAAQQGNTMPPLPHYLLDGVVELANGSRAYAMTLDGNGLMAEKALVNLKKV